MQISEMLHRDVVTASCDMPLAEAARIMKTKDVGFLPVLDGERLVGIVTDRDIVLRGVAESRNAPEARLCDVISLEVVCCFADDTPEHANQLMLEHNLRRLPVIDRNHHLVGVVTLPDLQHQDSPRKKGTKVTFHRELTDSYGRPHQVPIRTVYITGVTGKAQAEAAAVKRLEEETGHPWTDTATGMSSEEEPNGRGGGSR